MFQVCELKFGSWTYDGFQVDITNRSDRVDLSNYVYSGEWELLDVFVERTEVIFLPIFLQFVFRHLFECMCNPRCVILLTRLFFAFKYLTCTCHP